MSKPPLPSYIDWSLYTGRWVAIVAGQITGVGRTAYEAQQKARQSRPRERITLHFIENTDGFSLQLSPILLKLQPVLQKLTVPVYLVGGAVRDVLLNRPHYDLDFVVPENGIKTAFQVGDLLGMPAYPLDKKRDMGRVVIAEEGTDLDFSVFQGENLEADLHNRDFTINAMALPAFATQSSSLIDFCHGQADLEQGVIRLVHDKSLSKDPIRALRAVRMAIKFGFTLLPETQEAIQVIAPHMSESSPERVRDELSKIIQTSAPHDCLAQLQANDLLIYTLPEIEALVSIEQSPPHYETVFAHTKTVLKWLVQLEAVIQNDEMPAHSYLADVHHILSPFRLQLQAHFNRQTAGGLTGWQILRWGALWHDAGKARTQTIENDGHIRFFQHDVMGAELALERLRQLHWSKEASEHVAVIVRGHMRPLLLAQSDNVTRRAIYRFFRSMEHAGIDIVLLSLADVLATNNHDLAAGQVFWRKLLSVVQALYTHYFQHFQETVKPPLFLNGNELMNLLSLPPGPEIGRLLRLLEEAQAIGAVTTKGEAIAFIQQASY